MKNKDGWKKKTVLTCLVICTKKEQIDTVNWQSLLFCAKSMVLWMDGWIDGWVDAWMDGWTDGWVGGGASLRIAYSNQKSRDSNSKHWITNPLLLKFQRILLSTN